MPCENCGVQFTVFRRKRTCNNCRRFYCSNCLINLKRNSQIVLCERCAVFAKRPLLRSDLLQLKPKDLIFFLQSKHISTKGCVEKDELIRLVLQYVDQTDAGGSEQQQQRNGRTESPGNSFDNLRQTCQNFFFNISDNISDSLASFDSKNSKPEKQDNNNVNDSNSNNSNEIGNMPNGRRRSSNNTNTPSSTASTVPPHIFDQPRVSRREIPTYASSLNSSGATNAPNPPQPQPASSTTTATTIIINERAPDCQQPTTSSRGPTSSSTSQSSSLASPIVSISSMASQTQVTGLEEAASASNLNVPTKQSDCECSDEELFANYAHARNSLTAATATTTTTIRTMTTTPPIQSPNLGPQQTTAEATTQNAQGTKVSSPKTNAMTGDEVSHSSFEELGAVGCSAEDSGGSSNTEAWQLLEPTDNAESIDAADDTAATSNEMGNKCEPTGASLQRKKLLRRRSDRQRSSVSEELQSPISSPVINAMTASENSTKLESVTERTATGLSSISRNDSVELPPASRRPSGTCRRCGKSNIRRYIEKLRQHLESAQMSEADIKQEMNEFLAYLDEQTRSIDYSETETSASSNGLASGNAQIVLSPTITNRPPFFIDFVDDNDGINGAYDSASSTEQNARFINIRNIDRIEKLEALSVKQLKEVLMLHRVDFKGCCEKQELFERVERLWKEIKTSPAVESLGTDELCKICMDAPIDCVLLECGHMATCTKCGKVLSECPICRQYIVRVVHTFRA